MSLPKHAGRIWRCNRRPSQTEHLWIGDDLLETTFRDFFGSRECLRTVGSVPGPLEARKRTAKRRIAHQSAGLDIFGSGRGILREWQEAQVSENDRRKRKEEVKDDEGAKGWSLMSWLQSASRRAGQEHDQASAAFALDSEFSQIYEDIVSNIHRYTVVADLRDALTHSSFKGQDASQEVFMKILELGHSNEYIFEFLEDRFLNPPGSGNLLLFLGSRSADAPDDAGASALEYDQIASWIRMQITIGKFSMQEFEELLQSIEQISLYRGATVSVSKLVSAFIEGVDACPVLSPADIKFSMTKRLTKIYTQLPLEDRLRELVQHFLSQLPRALQQPLSNFISESFFHGMTATTDSLSTAPYPSLNSESRVNRFISSLTSMLPVSLLPSVIFSISKQIMDKHLSTDLGAMWWQALGKNGLLMLFVQNEQGNRILKTLFKREPKYGAFIAQYIDDREFAQSILHHWCPSSPGRTVLSQILLLEKRTDRCLPLIVQHATTNQKDQNAFVGRLFNILHVLGKTPAIINIIRTAQNLGYLIPQPSFEAAVARLLPTHSDIARDFFLNDRRVALESRPEVMENFILGYRIDTSNVWAWFDRKRPKRRETLRVSANGIHEYPQSLVPNNLMGDTHFADRQTQPFVLQAQSGSNNARAILLERMAISFAVRQTFTAEPLFLDVFRCLKTHVEEQLGPPGPLLIRAVVQTGLVDLLRQKRFVHQARVQNILSLVSKFESEDAACKMEHPLQTWREGNHRDIVDSFNTDLGNT